MACIFTSMYPKINLNKFLWPNQIQNPAADHQEVVAAGLLLKEEVNHLHQRAIHLPVNHQTEEVDHQVAVKAAVVQADSIIKSLFNF